MRKLIGLCLTAFFIVGCGGGTETSGSSDTSVATEDSIADTTLEETTTTTTTEAPLMAASFSVLDDRGWKLLNKNPDAQSGTGVLLYGTIIQFDARTGPTTFKAVVYRDKNSRDSDSYLNNFTIADISGDEAMMSQWLQEDKFSCECTVVASNQYTTQNNETRLSILMNAKSLTQG